MGEGERVRGGGEEGEEREEGGVEDIVGGRAGPEGERSIQGGACGSGERGGEWGGECSPPGGTVTMQ